MTGGLLHLMYAAEKPDMAKDVSSSSDRAFKIGD
jgi:hypothetical protein